MYLSLKMKQLHFRGLIGCILISEPCNELSSLVAFWSHLIHVHLFTLLTETHLARGRKRPRVTDGTAARSLSASY